MKIIAIGRNYAEHAKELNNPVPAVPVIFMKPDTAVLKDNKPFYHPEFSTDIHHEIELVLKVSKEGKHIAQKFASTYFDEIGLGIDFTARDIQQKHKEKGLPWELAKAFDNSAPVSKFIPKSEFKDLNNLNLRLDLNDNTVQEGNTKDLLFSFEYIIAFVSQYITLKKGDLIFTGTPKGVGKVNIGDHLCGYLEDQKLLDFYIR
ncbi:MAG: 2-hydroxyhepta-2,4-diene-1,7-dioate isomerase [Sphingobacteriales bacterium 17-39-43]|uniref:fumarylacetoacetate hydrolase family protein n=1 Tax=Daejeonella sp. TaxID=2805397 RepID=UPI000BD341FC|nr:fumarylacetoacetate hydrolase family protein [Daejeonella sp.]OYY00220.1 MAG: 2-hydroxyhepta-2,4-diene-1,7-dioate isomerase [Sphingobacteriia bacterium 35-40-5]OYZ33377.1 MAG: 2-hydroxyhepta-2,4-diene-1,7-dioate isomerase [Sphingobacteriales bacterium 16-39-50]OZA24420.1 MAG: 2-hydroxyhepta-2,4-diene-1,7-dioate isomerase [Sphingobacteriales bacterium 17-39-43]OZA55566.1 MAG: 2-hydroxyhepta-2,4-diene-1,7-dioate isomerase [Sphingobacteriales bacterium 39-40-5]HQS51752.1 fumarylacetoacetate hy